MKLGTKAKTTFATIFIIASLFIPYDQISPKVVYGQTSAEIGEEISDKKNELNDLKAKLSKLQSETNSLISQKGGLSGEIAKLENEIATIQNQIEINKLKIQELDGQKDIKQLEIVGRRKTLNEKLRDYYKIIQKEKGLSQIESVDTSNYWLGYKYTKVIIDNEKSKIDELGKEVLGINSDILKFEEEKASHEEENETFATEKAELEKQLATLNANINAKSADQSQLRNQISSSEKLVEFLTAEQKRIEEEERRKLEEAGGGETIPLKSGDYYFTGTARDLYAGHYVGMSQWGAYGMALAGRSYTQILQKFYTGVTVGSYPGISSHITVKYCPDNPNTSKYEPIYDHYNNCTYGSPVTVRLPLNEYLGGLSEVPSSWPTEAKKAQIVAARTYALKSTNNGSPSSPICTTAHCQVYRPGSTTFRSVADATNNTVVLYQGNLISALYSATACGHTEDNEKVFNNPDASGGTPYAYLRGVDYSQYDPNVSTCNYGGPNNLPGGWRTNGYTIDQISAIFATDSYTNVGTIESLTLIRGSSPNVWKVTMKGSGGTKVVAGWKFKSVWNLHPSIGHPNYIYGLNFKFLQAE